VRIGKIDGNFVVNPDEADLVGNTDLDLIVAGTDEAILMVEAGANEIPRPRSSTRSTSRTPRSARSAPLSASWPRRPARRSSSSSRRSIDEDLVGQIAGSHGAQLDEATSVEDKLARQDATKAVEEAVLEQYSGDPEAETYAEYRQRAQLAFDRLEKTIIRERIAKQKRRPTAARSARSGRSRSRSAVAPRTHGSALFTRGQTQALSVAALGTLKEEMRLDTSGSRRRSSTGTTTTSRRSRWARPASCAAPSAATSATARWPSGRSCRSCRAPRTSRTRFASCRTSSSPTARRRWPRCAARRWR
jgi:polyribonucleotide nucleotidyltransferase